MFAVRSVTLPRYSDARCAPLRLVVLAILLWMATALSVGCGGDLEEFAGEADSFRLTSQSVGDDYEITLFYPSGWSEADGPLDVVLQMDGDSQGELMAAVAQEQQAQVLVVGVGYGDNTHRNRDYTPTSVDGVLQGPTGGADAFLDMLVDELRPRLQEEYYADPNGRWVISGHSLGGLIASYALVRSGADQHGFTGFIAASPSLWWDSGQALLEEQRRAESTDGELVGRVFLSVGELEFPEMHIYMAELANRLIGRGYAALVVDAVTINNAGHVGVLADSYRAGLRFVLSEDGQ